MRGVGLRVTSPPIAPPSTARSAPSIDAMGQEHPCHRPSRPRLRRCPPPRAVAGSAGRAARRRRAGRWRPARPVGHSYHCRLPRASLVTLTSVTERSEADIALANWQFAEGWLERGRACHAGSPAGPGVSAPFRSAPAAARPAVPRREHQRACRSSRSAPVPASPARGCCAGWHPTACSPRSTLEPEHQRVAKQTFLAAGFPLSRFRLIAGNALEVLPRLTDGAYDMVFVDASQGGVRPPTSTRPSGCFGRAGSWRSTTRCGMAGSLIPATATRPPSRCASCSSESETTSAGPAAVPNGDGLLAAIVRDTSKDAEPHTTAEPKSATTEDPATDSLDIT